MKRGFLNTARSKRVIDEAYSDTPQSQSPHGTKRRQPLHSARGSHDGAGGMTTVAAEGVMDVDMTGSEDVSIAVNRVAAVRTTQSTEGEATLPSLEENKTEKVEPPSKDLKGKGKEKAVDADGDHGDRINCSEISTIPPRPFPRRPGWGRDPDEDMFHTVPRSHGGPHKKRAVFRLWPRDPKGRILMPTAEPRGKLSPDGYPWGETLYDIFTVFRAAEIPFNVSTIMTGSALVEAMKEIGELDAAQSEMEWALSEGEPRILGVADTAELIESMERRLQLRSYHNFSMRDEVRKRALPIKVTKEERVSEGGIVCEGKVVEVAMEDIIGDITMADSGEDYAKDGKDHNSDEDHKEDEDHNEEDDDKVATEDGDEEMRNNEVEYDDTKVDPASIPPPPVMPITSPFHQSHYPEPWPFIPFENPISTLLQERIPLHLLPKTLYVHDPFNLLAAKERRFRDTSWMSRPDIIRTYSLNFSESVRKEVEEARRKAEELEEFKARTLIILRYMGTKEQIKNREPMIEVPLPPYPRRLTKVEESHLYISPVAKVGDGNHSIVYKGEWELPRDVFTKPKLCRTCFQNSVDKEIQRLKDTGRWEKMLKAAGYSSTGSPRCEPKQEDLDEVNDPTNLERDGEIIEREITCVVSPNTPPLQVFQLVNDSDIWTRLMKDRTVNAARLHFVHPEEDEEDSTNNPRSVPIIRIDPPVAYEGQRTCDHGPRPFSVPRTAKFTVVAKLSLEHDNHLAREATNYQEFPEHFFHHYNGYTIFSQLHAIVPVSAVVPQFYGYYRYKKDRSEHQNQYFSPILLLEHCGKPIDPENLSAEDQEECASLLLRFQRAGWIHESIAPRNYLVQPGKPTEFPLTREVNPDPSFRLIDFGRSKKYTQVLKKRQEEMWALGMFEKLWASMNVTLG